MYLWVPVDGNHLWGSSVVSLSSMWWWWWCFSVLHYVCWAAIFAGCFVMDIGELVGFKQVCYSARGHDNPMYWKSYQLNRLLGHMRHPSFLALSAILWGRPSMPLDRALLAISFTLYPLAYFDVDAEDHRYVCSWFKSKHRLLLAKDSQRKA